MRGRKPELHALPRHGEGAGDHRLAGDDGGEGGQHHQRQPQPVRAEQKERIVAARRVAEHQRALAEIVQHQGRQDEEDPAPADRLGAEMAHIGVERLGAGDRQHHRAQHDEGRCTRCAMQKCDRIAGDDRAAGRTDAAGICMTPSSGDGR